MKFLSAFFTGAILQTAYVFSFIHEMGHHIVASFYGIPSTIHWRYTTFHAQIPGRANFAITWAGVVFEMYTLLLISLLLAWKSPKRTFFIWMFYFASMTSYLSAVRQTDMKLLYYRGMGAWYAIGAIFLFVTLFFIVPRLKREKRHRAVGTGYSHKIMP